MPDHPEVKRVPESRKDAVYLKKDMEQGDRDCLRSAIEGLEKCSIKGIHWPGMDKEQREAFDRAIIFGADKAISEAIQLLARDMSLNDTARILLVIDALRVAAEFQMGPESIVVQTQTIHSRLLSTRVCRRLLLLSERTNANGSPARVMNNYLEIIQDIMMTGKQIRDHTVEQRQVYVHMKCIWMDSVDASHGSGAQSTNSLPGVQELHSSMCIGPKLWGTGDSFEAISTLKIETGIDTTKGAETQLSGGGFTFKAETSSGTQDKFHHGGKRSRRLARIKTSTGENRLYNGSLPASHASEPSHHQRSWVHGGTTEGISTEYALKRFTVPGAPVEDENMSCTRGDDKSNNDNNQKKENNDMNSSTMQQAVDHLDNEWANAFLQEVMSFETCPYSTNVENKMVVEEDEKPVKEDEWYLLY